MTDDHRPDPNRPPVRLDGLGQPITDDGEYYVQDRRNLCGNCAFWWAPNGNGYVCDLREAGVYKADRVRGMRDTDVPWPVAYVRDLVVHHVRGDTQALERRDGYKPPRARRR